ncbi:S1 family peptidase [Bradyrhizobium sp. UFLA05-112]
MARYEHRLMRVGGTALMLSLACLNYSSVGAGEAAGKPNISGHKHVIGAETESLVRVVDGTLTTWYPTVGALLHMGIGGLGTSCTGTIIGCDAFLTAAHCVTSDLDKSHYKVFLQHAGVFDVRSIDWPKRDYQRPNEETGSQADVAVIRLVTPVDGIVPDIINDDREQASGSVSKIVGFGRTTADKMDAGLKRYGDVVASACPDKFPKSDLICWRYTPGSGSNTCYGDSGGPLLLESNRPEPVVSGVTSGGIDLTCAKLDRAYDASVFKNRNWIKKAAGTIKRQCGSLLPLDSDDEHRYVQFTGQINDAYPEHVFEFSVQAATRLRVSANLARSSGAKDDLLHQPTLLLLPKRSRDQDDAICRDQPHAQVAFCEKPSPPDDLYTVILRRGESVGSADFQLVVSVY